MVIKIVLIAAVVLAALVLARGGGQRRQALRRLGLAAFAAVAVASIIQPDMLTGLARRLGVGRGADLLLYALIVVFFSYISTRHLRDQRTLRQLTALARRVALIEAPPHRRLDGEPSTAPGASPIAVGSGLNDAPEEEADEGVEVDGCKPDSGRRRAGQPEGGHREPGQPEGGHREPAQPEGGHREPAQPEGGHREPGQPEGGHREPGQPEGGHRRAGQPGCGHREPGQQEGDHPRDDRPSRDLRAG
ncbi:MAG: DUF2304 domain-containing protein [Bifidobacteriaceae bacterium]|nr:DUF2304 domain-containing protein [Bifidobacteriaceae bacterium]